MSFFNKASTLQTYLYFSTLVSNFVEFSAIEIMGFCIVMALSVGIYLNPDFAVEIYYKKEMLQIQAFA
jgi:hypothetical protein